MRNSKAKDVRASGMHRKKRNRHKGAKGLEERKSGPFCSIRPPRNPKPSKPNEEEPKVFIPGQIKKPKRPWVLNARRQGIRRKSK